jgi:hypothetical protein
MSGEMAYVAGPKVANADGPAFLARSLRRLAKKVQVSFVSDELADTNLVSE